VAINRNTATNKNKRKRVAGEYRLDPAEFWWDTWKFSSQYYIQLYLCKAGTTRTNKKRIKKGNISSVNP
jgi:hypothetical protein